MEEYVLKPIMAKVFQKDDEDGFAENTPMDADMGEVTPYIDTYNGMIRTFGRFDKDMLFINGDGERELMDKDKFLRMYERNQ